MTKQLLINMPVNNEEESTRFFKAAGFALNEEMSDEQATCFNIDENIIIALLPTAHFKDAINDGHVADATTHEVLLSIGMESKEEVDGLVDKALVAGGKQAQKTVDMPEIYGRTFTDLDGHLWNIFSMSA